MTTPRREVKERAAAVSATFDDLLLRTLLLFRDLDAGLVEASEVGAHLTTDPAEVDAVFMPILDPLVDSREDLRRLVLRMRNFQTEWGEVASRV